MIFDILTLFPAMFQGPFDESIIKRARDKGLIDIDLHNIRDYAPGRHHVTDDAPYGGGSGMLMKPEPLASCLNVIKEKRLSSTLLITTPGGKRFTHRVAREYSKLEGLIIICGRYEGIDERIRELFVCDEVSVGDFVLSGGEIAAMAIVDAVTRLIPGALGSHESAEEDSFSSNLLEYPQYTRPPEFLGLSVPPTLLSGNHETIRRWRRKESLRKTLAVRPELLANADLTEEDYKLLSELEREHAAASQ